MQKIKSHGGQKICSTFMSGACLTFAAGVAGCQETKNSSQGLFLPSSAFAPSGPGLIDVKARYGAKGDGKTDDTAAIQRAITENIGIDVKTNNPGSTLYFPPGTYVLSDTLWWKDSKGKLTSWISIQGSGSTQTFFRLRNNARGFDNPDKPKAIFYTSSANPNPCCGNEPGVGNEGYRMMMEDFAIDVGKGNAGATAVRYQPNNMGAMRNVSLRSSDAQKRGAIGLHLYGWAGPTLIKNVSIDGFDTGVLSSGTATFEHIQLSNQRRAGMHFRAGVWGYGMTQTIRNLTSNNSVPAIVNDNVNGDRSGLVVLLDGKLQNGDGKKAAIQMDDGALYVRNLSTAGYASAISFRKKSIPGHKWNEWSSHNPLGPTAANSLQDVAPLALPVRETPLPFSSNDPDDWANVRSYKSPEDKDDTPAIQKAIDSGKPIVYFPPGFYYVSKTIFIRKNVRRIAGMMSQIQGTPGAFSNDVDPVALFQVDDTSGPEITIEKLNVWPWGNDHRGMVPIANKSSRTLILRDLDLEHRPLYQACYANSRNNGDLFIENVMATKWRFNYPQNVWARHWDTEWVGPGVLNRGGALWILGMKTEHGITAIENYGGRVELFGGAFWSDWFSALDNPALLNVDGEMWASFASPSAGDAQFPKEHGPYQTYIRELQAGQDHSFTYEKSPHAHGSGRIFPVYSSRK